MDLLRTGVVDITTLIATCHALKSNPTDGEWVVQRKLRNMLRRDIKRGAVAYTDALARTRRSAVDDDLICKCRVAAEQRMAFALEHAELLGRIMTTEPDSLDGMPAARHDLWRLANMAMYLNRGMATLRQSPTLIDADSADDLAVRLRRRLRKALIAYARAALRSKAPRGRLVVKAREAALAELSSQGLAEAEGLAGVEIAADATLTVIRQGLTKPLLDLTLDWRQREPSAD